MTVILVVISIVLIGLDQLFKYLAVIHIKPVGYMDFIPNFMDFRYLENTGAAFSMLKGMQGLLVVVTGIALLVVAYLLFVRFPRNFKTKKLEIVSLVLIFSGGVGNLIDRIMNGYVVDYLNFTFMDFAVFNFADMLVCVGFGLLVIALIRAEVKLHKEKKDNPNSIGPLSDEDKQQLAETTTAEDVAGTGNGNI